MARLAGERLRALEREAEGLAATERTVLGDLRKLELDRQIKTEALKQAEARADAVSAELTETGQRIATLERQEQDERPGLRARLVEIYKLGEGRYLRLLLSTADVHRMAQATRTVAMLAEQDRRRIAAHEQTLGELRAARTALAARRTEADQLRDQARRAQAAAVRAADARNALIREIDQRRDLNAQLTSELQAAQAKLQAAVRDLGSGSTEADAGSMALSLPLRPFRGVLPWPAPGPVRRRFGGTATPGAAASNGIEIAVDEGTPARAVHDGVVAFAGPFAGFGNLVIIDHGAKAFSLYGNLLDVAVARGARVARGEKVGTVGPSPTGPAGLYFELRIDGRPVDPLQWLGKR
ncbi:MAG: murein hydrolase activator EnvC family protein [Betaproteobacteria bacterium]